LLYWRDVYREMARLMAEAGVRPYLQFGEVQWWYFPSGNSGMPLYDEYARSTFQAAHGRELPYIARNDVDLNLYRAEAEHLSNLIGSFTTAIVEHVRAEFPDCRFEVLYPTDVNATAFNEAINFASSAWTPTHLENLKTESFTFTLTRDMNASNGSIAFGRTLGFSSDKRSHLVGISDVGTAWVREAMNAREEQYESIVLFALDQFCLIGYPAHWDRRNRHASFQG
jgi:hypothetical protein